MISLVSISSILLSTSLINAQGNSNCSTAESLECLRQLQALQSPEQCGPVTFMDDPKMGHKMPTQHSWTMCACNKISQIVECLDKSSCAADKQVVEDFSGIVMHCGDDMGHETSNNTSNPSNSVSPTPKAKVSPNSGFNLNVPLVLLVFF